MARSPSTMMFLRCLGIVALAQYTQATTPTHVVGDSLGWVIPPAGAVTYTTWASTQNFKVGDTLVFYFAVGLQNVVEVTMASYDACDTTNQIGSVVTDSPAKISVNKAGQHYYICSVGGVKGHCFFGQKLAINVSAAAMVATPAPKASPSPSTMSPASAPSSVPASAPSITTATISSSPSSLMGTTETTSTPIGAPSPPIKVQAFTGTYGIIADNIIPPESVVTLLKAAKIKNIRIYDADHSVLKAFKGSGIEIVVGIGNELLQDMSVYKNRALMWVKKNVESYLPDTHIRGIAVGNEILGRDNAELSEVLLGVVKNVYSAIDKLHLTNLIQISSPHSQGVFTNTSTPSSCVFKENVKQYMKPLLEFFTQIGSPFFINAYPFLAYISDPEHIDVNYALFEKNPGIVDPKTNLHYDNMFDAQIDAAYAALTAAGYEKMEVVVSETGWASKGDSNEVGATVQNARTYNRNLRKRLAKKKGTPLKPKTPVKAYVYALFNENLKPGRTSERNFGLFKPDGSIAYDIGFPGLKPRPRRHLF